MLSNEEKGHENIIKAACLELTKGGKGVEPMLKEKERPTRLDNSGPRIRTHISDFSVRLYFNHAAVVGLSNLPLDDMKDNIRDWLTEDEEDGGDGLAGEVLAVLLLYIVLLVEAMVSLDRDSGGNGANLVSYGLFPGGTPFIPQGPLPSDCGPQVFGPFDTYAVLPNGHAYVTKGGRYVKYESDGITIGSDFPKPIRGNWGDLPESFNEGFDTMATLPNGNVYVTKGDQYIKYSDDNANDIESGYPKPIRGNWGNLPESFNEGFDSMSVLPDGRTFVTKGDQWVAFTDDSGSSPGSASAIRGAWGNIPESFNEGFDSMGMDSNGKVYVTKGNEYVRYSDRDATTVDSGYPTIITGSWGRTAVPF